MNVNKHSTLVFMLILRIATATEKLDDLDSHDSIIADVRYSMDLMEKFNGKFAFQNDKYWRISRIFYEYTFIMKAGIVNIFEHKGDRALRAKNLNHFEFESNASELAKSLKEHYDSYNNAKNCEMKASLKELNDFLSEQGQAGSQFKSYSKTQVYLTFFEVRLKLIMHLFEKIGKLYANYTNDEKTGHFQLMYLYVECTETRENTKKCIKELKRPDSIFNNIQMKVNANVYDTVKIRKLFGKLLSSLRKVRNRTARILRNIDYTLLKSNIFLDTEELLYLTKFLLARVIYEHFNAKCKQLNKSLKKHDNSSSLFFAELQSMIEDTSLNFKAERLNGIKANRALQKLLSHIDTFNFEGNLYDLVSYIGNTFKSESLAEVFEEFINTFCVIDIGKSDTKKQFSFKIFANHRLRDSTEVKALFKAWYMIAIEHKADLQENEMINAEFAEASINLEIYMWKFRFALNLLGDIQSTDLQLRELSLVKSLPEDIKLLYGSAHVYFKLFTTFEKKSKRLQQSFVDKLQKLTVHILEKNYSEIKHEEVVISTSTGLTSVFKHPKSASKALPKRIHVDKNANVYEALKRNAAERNARYRARARDVVKTKCCLDKQQFIIYKLKASDDYKKLSINLDQAKKLAVKLGGINVDGVKVSHANTEGKFGPDVVRENELVSTICAVYEEDIKLFELYALYALSKEQRNQSINEIFQPHHLAILTGHNLRILDLTTKILISCTKKIRLTKKIAQIQQGRVRKAKFNRIGKTGNAQTKTSICVSGQQGQTKSFGQLQQVLKEIMDAYETYLNTEMKVNSKLRVEKKTNVNDSDDAINKNSRIVSLLTSVFSRYKPSVDAIEKEGNSTELQQDYINLLYGLRSVYNTILAKLNSELAGNQALVTFNSYEFSQATSQCNPSNVTRTVQPAKDDAVSGVTVGEVDGVIGLSC